MSWPFRSTPRRSIKISSCSKTGLYSRRSLIRVTLGNACMVGWKFEAGKAPKATIWASKMAPGGVWEGSRRGPKGVPEGSGRALGSRRGPGGVPEGSGAGSGPQLGPQDGPMLSPFITFLARSSRPFLGTCWRSLREPSWERFGGQLGPQMGPGMPPERLLTRSPARNRENAENAQPSYVFARYWASTWARNRTQEGPRRDWTTVSSARRKNGPLWARFGPNLGPKMGPEIGPRQLRNGPRQLRFSSCFRRA